MSIPNHVAIIMDGNGRWAKARKHHRVFGHVRGMKVVRSTIESVMGLGISELSLFALSNENWNRPSFEVTTLMKILRKFLKSELKFLMDNNIQLRVIGELSRLPEDVQTLLAETRFKTSTNSGLKLCLAISYGSRQEIVKAAKKIHKAVEEGNFQINDLDEDSFSKFLDADNNSYPDLLIRTSGESRLSNFLLFQSAYSEIYFSNVLWPDFCHQDLIDCLEWYDNRERRFGLTSEQKQNKGQAYELSKN